MTRGFDRPPALFWPLAVAAVVLLAVGVPFALNRTAPATAASEAAAPTEAPVETTAPAALTLRQQLDAGQPVTITVIGDSTERFVPLMAEFIGTQFDRTVSVSNWDLDTLAYGAAETVHTGAGAAVTVWNGSAPGKSPAYSQENLPVLMAAPTNFVIVNHGHNTGPDRVLDISRLTDDLQRDYPDVPLAVTVQNPYLGSGTQAELDSAEATAETVRQWSQSKPWITIDVYSAFVSAPNFLDLYDDNRHPNDAGGELWASVVEQAIGLT